MGLRYTYCFFFSGLVGFVVHGARCLKVKGSGLGARGSGLVVQFSWSMRLRVHGVRMLTGKSTSLDKNRT
jgi:hypothetical protein